ncbi:hypothetical protein DPPLL_32500 [Desulfofustis limnaeus]|uniref:Uncharacterized protein n=1 Tax=Desulfofustis limnaeus TaxID=2740163 RepID=A0ABM7WD10_9BACT|nr:hypothetical protein DPPLL_32500 [Desulfofustis limnaeus]
MLSFDAYTNQYARSWETVSAQKGLNERDALYDANDDDFEAAMYVVLIHRLMNAYAVTRRTLEVVRHETPQQLIDTTGPVLRATISELSSHPRHLFGFPSFLQRFFFVWGGFIVEANRATEIEQMAREAGTSKDAVEHYLNVLDLLYQSRDGNLSLFQNWGGFRYFKFVPGALRALGFLHREAIAPELYANTEFFGRSGEKYRTALERALVDTGGTAALRYR